MKVCVIGLGYIGLPTASVLASAGHQVRGVDINPKVVAATNDGAAAFHEPGLNERLQEAVRAGRLVASAEPAAADVFVLAVPTPLSPGNGPDVSFVDSATAAVAPHVAPGNLVILESTVPVGTTEHVAATLARLRPDLAVAPATGDGAVRVAHCPERVLPGRILEELVKNDRIVGGVDDASMKAAKAFYASFVNGEVVGTDSRTAELCKLSENAFRDLNIAFANELSMLCDRAGVDVWRLIELANRHPRVNILKPGPGVGGHCIAVDPWFIISMDPDNARLIRAARDTNDRKEGWVVDQVLAAIDGNPAPIVACLGAAFKANVSDMRESPAIDIMMRVSEQEGVTLVVAEPHIDRLPTPLGDRPNVSLVPTEKALAEADVVLMLVDHDAFRGISAADLAGKKVIDTRGALRDATAEATREGGR